MPKEAVSIPSSRVGTIQGDRSKCLRKQFPSPQVGSGRFGRPPQRQRLRKFPSPQVGSGLQFRVITGSTAGGFHPLKSGRDQLHETLLSLLRKFPSPQVGSGPMNSNFLMT